MSAEPRQAPLSDSDSTLVPSEQCEWTNGGPCGKGMNSCNTCQRVLDGKHAQYATIVADPPWLYDYPGGPGHKAPWRIESAERYPRMTLDEICALDIGALAAPGAHLYIWAVLPILNRVFDVIDAWGFETEPTTTITWGKPGPGLGRGWRSSTEFLVCARDKKRTAYQTTHPGTLVMAPRGEHSAKPEVFQDLIETMSPGPYLELFARRARPGWDVWGNEIANDVEMTA